MKKLIAIPLCLILFTACNEISFKPDHASADDWDYRSSAEGGFAFGDEDLEAGGVETVLDGAYNAEILNRVNPGNVTLAMGNSNGFQNIFGTGSGDSPKQEIAQEAYAKKIIRTANMRAKVDDYHAFRADLASVLNDAEAYVSNENESNDKYSIEGNIKIKVPAANFDELVGGISGLTPKWKKKDINSQDVSDEYYDLETRIQTKEEMEKQYLEILKKAKTIEEILQVQDKLRVIREEIESSKGRLKYLASRVGMSTIHLNIFQEIENVEPDYVEAGFLSQAGDRFGEGWDDMKSFFLGLIEAWPVLLILFLLVYGFYKGIKWLIRRQPNAA